MEWFRGWLLGITGAAMLAAVAESLMPKGTVRRIGKLTAGIVLLLAAIQPIWQLEPGFLTVGFAHYRDAIQTYAQVPAVDSLSMMQDVIERECGAYVQEKARELGVECMAVVTCNPGEEYPVPVEVTVTGQWDEQQLAALREIIEKDLAVPPEGQRYQRESGDGR